MLDEHDASEEIRSRLGCSPCRAWRETLGCDQEIAKQLRCLVDAPAVWSLVGRDGECEFIAEYLPNSMFVGVNCGHDEKLRNENVLGWTFRSYFAAAAHERHINPALGLAMEKEIHAQFQRVPAMARSFTQADRVDEVENCT